MDIKAFFEKSCGKWFSQRTSQHLNYSQSEWGKSDVFIDLLEPTDAAVQQVCEKHGVDASQALCGMQVKWEGFLGAETSKQMGLTTLVAIASDQPNQGQLLRHTSKPQPFSSTVNYVLDDQDILSLSSNHDGMETEERLWFVSDNLRLRTSVVKRPDSFDTSSFVSEIRIASTPPKEQT
ncbi:MAG: phycobiliprotein lyase [Elainellaceae cyanobacterium]